MRYIFAILLLMLVTGNASAAPVLNFSDIISGPDTGLDDTLGSGAIVTIWGNRLGSSQGDSTLQVCGTSPAHIYYWKNADGTLPSGPADLHTSHQMQEIAFSLPASCSNGATTISVTVDGVISNTLPFTVRAGNIYHAMTTGSGAGDGSWGNPWQQVSGAAEAAMVAGDILYLHDGTEDNGEDDSGITGVIIGQKTGTLANQHALVAYPDARYTLTGPGRAFSPWESSAWVTSKMLVLSGQLAEPDPASTTALGYQGYSGQGIGTTQNGRAVGNEITEIVGMCSSGGGGAIVGSNAAMDVTGNFKMLGNYIHDWGCAQTSHFEHTTYISIRNPGLFDVSAWEMGWNHLTDNEAKYGLHNYDELYQGECGGLIGTVKIHDNYINNQKGPGINIGIGANQECWDDRASFEVYNNVIIEAGKGPEYTEFHGPETAAIQIYDQGISSNVYIYNNTIYGWGDDTDGVSEGIVVSTFGVQSSGVGVDISNNIIYDTRGGVFTSTGAEAMLSGGNNITFSTGGGSGIDPELTGTITDNPDFISASNLQLTEGSPAIDAGVTGIHAFDLLAQPRSVYDLGAYEYIGVNAQPYRASGGGVIILSDGNYLQVSE